MIASNPTIATPIDASRFTQLVRELIAATPLLTFVSALRGH